VLIRRAPLQVPIERVIYQDKFQDREKVVYQDRTIEIEKVIEVPVDRIVEVEKVVYRDKPVIQVSVPRREALSTTQEEVCSRV